MSLATLKKKTKAVFNNPHIGDKYGKYSKMSAVRMNAFNNTNGNINAGFSLNGTHRSQGYVGQTMHSRHFTQTPMRGNVARGSGGHYGTYNANMVTPEMTYMNDPNTVKSSVSSTLGHYHKSYRWIWRPQPFTSVKPDHTHNINNQDSYINHKSKKNVLCADLSNNLIEQKPCFKYLSDTVIATYATTTPYITDIIPLLNQAPNTTILGQTNYGQDGTYYVTSSVISDYGPIYNNYQAFTYSYPSNAAYWAADSHGSITIESGTKVKGEWLQIQLPNPVQMTSFSMYPSYASPQAMIIAGSNDGITWDNITSIASTQLPNTDQLIGWNSSLFTKHTYPTTTNTNYYTYFRFIVTTPGTITDTTQKQTCIGILNISGYVQTTTKTLTANPINTVIYSKLKTNTITKPTLINKTSKTQYEAGLTAGQHIFKLANNCKINDDFKIPNNTRNMTFGC